MTRMVNVLRELPALMPSADAAPAGSPRSKARREGGAFKGAML